MRVREISTSLRVAIVVVALAAMLANLICYGKRLLAPVGIAPHDLFGAGILLRAMSYALFGLLAGLIATVGSYPFRRRHKPGESS